MNKEQEKIKRFLLQAGKSRIFLQLAIYKYLMDCHQQRLTDLINWTSIFMAEAIAKDDCDNPEQVIWAYGLSYEAMSRLRLANLPPDFGDAPPQTNTQALYKFYIDFGRGQDLSYAFIENVTAINEAMGQKFSISDALGKHGHVEFTLERDMITLISSSPEVLGIVKELGILDDSILLYIYKSCSKCDSRLYQGEDQWICSQEDKETFLSHGVCSECFNKG